MIEEYANQTLTLKKPLSVNEYNEATYSTTTIRGRKETGIKLVRNNQGEEVVSSARVFTGTAITANDLIDNDLVLAVDTAIDLDGTVGYYTGYLK
jgi:hypothetical protein